MTAPTSSSRGPLDAQRARRGILVNADPVRWGAGALAEIAVAVALASVLGLVKLFALPQGGSISLEMVPLLFVAVRRGLVPGITAGALFGFVQLLLPGFFAAHPVQVALDYPLAFAALGLAALVPVRGWGTLAAAVAVGAGARFGCHFLSGLVFFGAYAWGGWPVWAYSLVYNASYLVPETLLSTLILWPLLTAYDAAAAGRGRPA